MIAAAKVRVSCDCRDVMRDVQCPREAVRFWLCKETVFGCPNPSVHPRAVVERALALCSRCRVPRGADETRKILSKAEYLGWRALRQVHES